MQKSKANIIIHFKKSYFFVGSSIKGNIEINSGSSGLIKDIIIEIFLNEEWDFKEGDKYKIENNRKKIASYQIDLNKLNVFKKVDEDNFLLPVGITFIPFDFHFSEKNSPCFEYPLPDKRAFIRYSFSAMISSKNITGSATTPIIFLSRPIIKSNKILSQQVKQTIKKWKLIGEGNTILKVSIPDDNYKINSICELNIEIDNTKGKIAIKEYKVTLIRSIKYKSLNNVEKHKNTTKIVRERVKAEVKQGQKKDFKYNLKFKEKNVLKKYKYNLNENPYHKLKMEEINFFMPTVQSQIIACDYTIKVCLYFEAFVDKNHRPRVKIPVYLVHQLPKNLQLGNDEQIGFEEAIKSNFEEKKMVNNISKSYNIYINNNQIYNFNNNNNYIIRDNKSFMNKLDNNYNLNDNNYSLPSMEDIEKVNKEKKQNEINNINSNQNINNFEKPNKKNEIINNYENDIKKNQYINNYEGNKMSDINENYDAPVPLGLSQNINNFSDDINNNNNYDIKEVNHNIINNNIYPNLEGKNINNNEKINYENNNNKNINNNENINNYEINNIEKINLNKSDDEDFSLFNQDTQDNQPNNSKDQNEKQNKYQNINEI